MKKELQSRLTRYTSAAAAIVVNDAVSSSFKEKTSSATNNNMLKIGENSIEKNQKQHILMSFWVCKHHKAGQNTQQLGYLL